LYNISSNINKIIRLFGYKCVKSPFNNFVCVDGGVAYLTTLERRIFKRVQFRKSGLLGLLQPFSDGSNFLNDVIPLSRTASGFVADEILLLRYNIERAFEFHRLEIP